MSSHVPDATFLDGMPTESGGSERVLVEALGAIIAVEGLSTGESAQFRQAWNRCLAPADSSVAATVQRIPGDFSRANEMLTSAITLAAIEILAGQAMMFHACGLADPDTGATIAFVAPSGTGKTTVAKTLGPIMGYVSDETIAVSPELAIIAYPKPLSVKQAPVKSSDTNSPERGLPKLQQGPDAHRLGVTPSTPALAAIALLSRTSGSSPATLENVSLAKALVELTPQLSALSRLDRGLVQLCSMIESCGGVMRVLYSEAADIETLLPRLASTRQQEGVEWKALDISPKTSNARSGVRRTEVQDAVDAEGTIVLLIDSHVLELGPLGGLIWEFTADWTSPEALLEKVVDVIGTHPMSGVLFTAALEELCSRGVLEAA